MVLAEVLGIWAAWRRRISRAPAGHAAASPRPQERLPAFAALDITKIEAAAAEMNERLWRIAYSAPEHAETFDSRQGKIRNLVTASLQVENIDPKFLPRRPTLMPQLLRAMDDPHTATGKLSRMVAHDPVLTGDVLRLANSSLHRTSATPIETIQRAIVALGADALRGLLAKAMLQPVFRATRTNFPRVPRLLWERTERAARAAELYSLTTKPEDRFESQLVILLSALGPLVVYGVTLDVYARYSGIPPNPALCVAMTGGFSGKMSLKIARHWETSPRLVSALEKSAEESLTMSLAIGELLGTLSLLESHGSITPADAFDCAKRAELPHSLSAEIWAKLASQVPAKIKGSATW